MGNGSMKIRLSSAIDKQYLRDMFSEYNNKRRLFGMEESNTIELESEGIIQSGYIRQVVNMQIFEASIRLSGNDMSSEINVDNAIRTVQVIDEINKYAAYFDIPGNKKIIPSGHSLKAVCDLSAYAVNKIILRVFEPMDSVQIYVNPDKEHKWGRSKLDFHIDSLKLGHSNIELHIDSDIMLLGVFVIRDKELKEECDSLLYKYTGQQWLDEIGEDIDVMFMTGSSIKLSYADKALTISSERKVDELYDDDAFRDLVKNIAERYYQRAVKGADKDSTFKIIYT